MTEKYLKEERLILNDDVVLKEITKIKENVEN